MLDWNAKNEIAARHLFLVDANPAEEGRDIAEENPNKADQLQILLIKHLKLVNAEKVKPTPARKKGKKGKGKGKKKAD